MRPLHGAPSPHVCGRVIFPDASQILPEVLPGCGSERGFPWGSVTVRGAGANVTVETRSVCGDFAPSFRDVSGAMCGHPHHLMQLGSWPAGGGPRPVPHPVPPSSVT